MVSNAQAKIIDDVVKGMSQEEKDCIHDLIGNILPDFPDEVNAQSVHYASLKQYIREIRDKTDDAPVMLHPGSGRPMCCGPNCNDYMRAHKGCKLVRGYKIFAAIRNGNVIGMKAVVHFVVRGTDGKLVDVTYEPDDRTDISGDFKIMFVPSARVCKDLSDTDVLQGANTYGYAVFGDEQYKNAVISISNK